MKKTLTIAAVASLAPISLVAQNNDSSSGFFPDWDSDNNADLTFWAPGMGDNPVRLTQIQGGGPGAQYIGNYTFYVIKGLSGQLTLGNRNNHDEFWQQNLNWHRPWSAPSWATFGFQINHRPYEQRALYLSVAGDRAGTSTGQVTQLLTEPVILESPSTYRQPITFVPHANAYFLPRGSGISNKTPSGSISLLADLYTEPIPPVGELGVDQEAVFDGETVTVNYSYSQGGREALELFYATGEGAPASISGGGN